MSDSSLSAASPPEPLKIDLLELGRLPSLVAAFLRGEDLDLLAPVRFDSAAGSRVDLGPPAEVDRESLAQALGEANQTYGHPLADELAQKLARPGTRVVITGQQPGILGGPLYTLSKAVAAQLWAERLERDGQPAVALFWMATEDHDFKESAETTFLSPRGPHELSLGDDEEPLVPVGLRRLGPAVERVLAELTQAMPGDRFVAWARELESWYRPEATFGVAFTGLMSRLMGERSPIWVDALLPALKQAQVPWLRRLVEERAAVAEAFAQRDEAIEKRGHRLQIRPQPGTGPLFVLDDRERRRVVWTGDDRFGLRGLDSFDQPIEALLDLIEHEPERVSPGARARVAVQDALFGSDLVLLGPGELSYLPQAAPLYELFGSTSPTVVLRPQVLVLEGHQRDKLDSLPIGLDALTSENLDLDEALADSESTSFLDQTAAALETLLQETRAAAIAVDPNLEGPWSKTRDQMQRALEAFTGKVTAAAGRHDEVTRGRAEALRQACMPLDKAQERVISTAHFPGKHGDEFVESMFEQMDLDPRYLGVVQP